MLQIKLGAFQVRQIGTCAIKSRNTSISFGESS